MGRAARWMASAGEEVAGPTLNRRVAKLRHGPGLDLADPLPGQMEHLADLVEGAGLAPVQAEAQPEDLPLPLVQAVQHFRDLIAQQRHRSGIEWRDGGLVCHQVTQLGVAVLAERLGQRDRLGRMAQDVGNPLARPRPDRQPAPQWSGVG